MRCNFHFPTFVTCFGTSSPVLAVSFVHLPLRYWSSSPLPHPAQGVMTALHGTSHQSTLSVHFSSESACIAVTCALVTFKFVLLSSACSKQRNFNGDQNKHFQKWRHWWQWMPSWSVQIKTKILTLRLVHVIVSLAWQTWKMVMMRNIVLRSSLSHTVELCHHWEGTLMCGWNVLQFLICAPWHKSCHPHWSQQTHSQALVVHNTMHNELAFTPWRGWTDICLEERWWKLHCWGTQLGSNWT